MKNQSRWSAYNGLKVVQYSSVGFTAIIGGLLKAEGSTWPDSARQLLAFSHNSAWWLVPACVAVTAAAKGISAIMGPPRVWKSVRKVLDKHREKAFDVEDGDPAHFYRVTLFKRVQWTACNRASTYWEWGWWRWPWSGWLVPVVRSGHTTQKTKTIFLAPDDAGNAEGVAGQVWASDQTIIVEDLPEITDRSSDEEVKEYAKKTFVSEEWVRKRIGKNPLSRSICGMPVEVESVKWGVLVLDSMRPGSLKTAAHGWTPYEELIPFFLNELLRRGG
jgi:GAF domain